MALKRMFSKKVVDTDIFMELSLTAKAFYFLLGIYADDDGFVSLRKVRKLHGGTDEDIKQLLTHEYIHLFKTGVVAIIHFHENNYLDKNKRVPTIHQKELQMLEMNNRKYILRTKTNQAPSKKNRFLQEPDFEDQSIEISVIEVSTNKNDVSVMDIEDMIFHKQSIILSTHKKFKVTKAQAKAKLERFINYRTKKSLPKKTNYLEEFHKWLLQDFPLRINNLAEVS